MENESELNDFVDKIIEDIESSLDKLENNFKLKNKQVEETNVEELYEEISTKTPYQSVRYNTPENLIHDYSAKVKPDMEDIPLVPEIPAVEKKNQEVKVEIEKPAEIVPEKEIQEIEEEEEELQIEDFEEEEEEIVSAANEVVSDDSEVIFLDIPKEVKLIHLFGPPGSAKTTLGIQTAIEIAPRSTYYFITSHATSVLKRVKQMMSDERWHENKEIKQKFFPIEISNLEVLKTHLDKIEEMETDNLGMIVIDHLTDYLRGQIHKEEKRKQLRDLLERLYLFADDKQCKIMLINGFSFKDSAPAEDIVESFCDLTWKMNLVDYKITMNDETETFTLKLDDLGVKNIYIDAYF